MEKEGEREESTTTRKRRMRRRREVPGRVGHIRVSSDQRPGNASRDHCDTQEDRRCP